MYFRNAVAAIVVYDVTDRLSFEHVDNWIGLIRQNAPTNICICLVGNKIDLVDEVSVTIVQGRKKA
jgi:GTPase SAR1 family protein